jgi:hypothetical protein
MPHPVSEMATITYCPTSTSGVFGRVVRVECGIGGLQRQLAAGRHGVARIQGTG